MSLDKINEAKGKLIFVFTSEEGSDFRSSQESSLNESYSELEELGVSNFFATQSEVESASSEVEGKVDSENSLVIFENDGGLKLAEVVQDISVDDNWVEIIKTYSENYKSNDPDDDNMYKWGQVVPEDGEYLCVDCGYILELKEGQVFPICEVCLSGLPEGPSGPEKGYWEKV